MATEIERMVEAAQQRRAAAAADVARMREERRAERIEGYRRQLEELFGARFVSLLGMDVEADDSDSCCAVFWFRDAQYSLRLDSSYRNLVRLDPRDEDDERPLPYTDVYLHWQNGHESNIDNLLVDLDSLSCFTVAPRVRRTVEAPRVRRTVEERLLSALRDLIDQGIYNREI